MVASRIIDTNLSHVVLVDIAPGLAKGKALDISDARPIFNSTVKIIGTEDYRDIKGSGIVVITAGFARKPGMSRDDLLKKNASIIKDIAHHVKKYCLYSIIIVVTNPLDVMTYVAMKEIGFESNRVIGMAGVLDSARFANIASGKTAFVDSDKVFMMGSHGDSMVGINRSKRLSKDIFRESSERAKNRGKEIVDYLKTGSAYFSPSAAVFYMLKAILNNEGKTMCASVYLQGEYGEKDIYIGVPVILDSSGVKEIVEIKLTSSEKKAFKKSALEIREAIKKL